MLILVYALAPRFFVCSARRLFAAFLFLSLPLLFPLAAHAQEDPNNPNPGGPNNPEESQPVVLTASVAPERVPITSGTATLTWSGRNARYCSVDGTSRAASGSATVGPWTTAGTKTVLIECWNNGKAGYAASTLSVTVYNVAKPVITTTLSKSLLEAGKDKFVVTYSATNAKSCMVGGTKFPASGSATLGPYSAGKHSLTFSCSGDGGTTSHTINWEAISRVSISASVSPGTVKANGSDTVRVSWTGSNADSCKLDGANASTSGSKTFGPYSYSQAGTKSATVSCANRLGSTSDSVSWKAEAPNPVVSATLSKYTVTAGVDRVDLSWTSSNADSCSYDGRTRAVNGTIRNLGPFTAGTHNFMVSCTGTGGTTSDTAMLTAEKAPDPPTVTVSLNPESIIASTGTATLSWSSTDATSCTRDSRAVATSGNASVGPYTQGSYDFTVSCTGPGGNASGMATLTVEPQPDPPTVTLRLNPATIEAGSDTSTLTWSSRNATSCSRDGTAVATGGSATVGPYATAGTRRFTVSCDGPGGSDSETRLLTVEQPDPPSVTVILSKTKITADKDTVVVTWSSTDAASCKYGSTNLSASGTRTIGPFSAGTHDIAVSCTGVGGTASASASLTAVKATADPDTDGDGTVDSEDTDDDNDGMPDACEIRYGFNPLDASDGGSTNSDGDGASNVHECKHGTDPTRTPAETVLPDTDGDGMSDAWEWNHGLDPDDADDALHDEDGDGYNNLEEHTARTDPNWDESHPKSVPELSSGFNDSYTVHIGNIDTGDMLKDILVRNPTKGVLPAVSDFVLVQREEGGFEIKDADDYMIPSNLTDISNDAEFVDLNGDGVKDLVLTGLDDHITGANDRVVYGNYYERHALPVRHTNLPPYVKKFFKELAAWIDDDKYFIKNAPKVSVPKIVGIEFLRDAENNIIARRPGGQTEIPLKDATGGNDCFEGTCLPVKRECETGSSFFCYVFTGDLNDLVNLPSGDPCSSGKIHCDYGAKPHKVLVTDVEDDPDENNYEAFIKVKYSPTVKVEVRDFSGFNQDAWQLASRYLQSLRAEGSALTPGTEQSRAISLTLEAYLGMEVLNSRLLGVGKGIYPRIESSDQYTSVVHDVLNTHEFMVDRLALPSPQNPVTEDERNSSPNLDAIPGLLRCTYMLPCISGDFSQAQKASIYTRLTELLVPLSEQTYTSADAAAEAIHKSDLHSFSKLLGIEVLVTIDDTSTPVEVTNVFTSFDTEKVGIPEYSLDKSLWHNHPNGLRVWQGDAAKYVNRIGSSICSSDRDYYVYASGYSLTKASIKQTIGITDPSSYKFLHHELQEEDNDWVARTSAYSEEAVDVDFECPKSDE